MKFRKTVNLWDPDTQDAVRTGKLVLQPGQWVRCGSDRLSRFVCISSGGSIWCVHPTGHPTHPTVSRQRFAECCRSWPSRPRKGAPV